MLIIGLSGGDMDCHVAAENKFLPKLSLSLDREEAVARELV
jgi:hypothetical protein